MLHHTSGAFFIIVVSKVVPISIASGLDKLRFSDLVTRKYERKGELARAELSQIELETSLLWWGCLYALQCAATQVEPSLLLWYLENNCPLECWLLLQKSLERGQHRQIILSMLKLCSREEDVAGHSRGRLFGRPEECCSTSSVHSRNCVPWV